MKKMILFGIYSLLFLGNYKIHAQVAEKNITHLKVYYEPGMYGGWPANNGIWIWGNEILVGFSKGFHKNLGSNHNIDRDKPQLHLLARSKDGGNTWSIEDPAPNGLFPHGHFIAKPRTDLPQQKVLQQKETINFKHPGFAFAAYSNAHAGESRYWYSYDKGHSWKGPFALPNFGAPGTAARTDYIIDGENKCTLFITAAKSNGDEGRVIAVNTKDGGKTWTLLSRIGEEPEGYAIMPASVRISANELLVTTRERKGDHSFIPCWKSMDNGKTWTQLKNASDDTGIGSPPAMIRLSDGRICLVYGYRADAESIASKTKTSDIRARLSNDNGETWTEEYILRNDGSGQDIGYPRIVQRPDGKIVMIYYFMDNKTGPERYIGASIWSPPAVGKE